MSKLLFSSILLLLACFPAAAQDTYVDPYKDYDEFLFFDLTLEQNVETPVVGKKERRSVRDYMSRVKDQLKGTYTLDLTRDEEVVIVSIPTDDLFLPNDTLLTPYGEKRLRPLLPYLQDPMMFKVVYTINTDDSGSANYLEHLSEARNNTIYGWLLSDKRIPDDLIVIPFSMASDDPLLPNDSRANRAVNRRLDIYLIPGPKMIQLAHDGKLK